MFDLGLIVLVTFCLLVLPVVCFCLIVWCFTLIAGWCLV